MSWAVLLDWNLQYKRPRRSDKMTWANCSRARQSSKKSWALFDKKSKKLWTREVTIKNCLVTCCKLSAIIKSRLNLNRSYRSVLSKSSNPRRKQKIYCCSSWWTAKTLSCRKCRQIWNHSTKPSDWRPTLSSSPTNRKFNSGCSNLQKRNPWLATFAGSGKRTSIL